VETGFASGQKRQDADAGEYLQEEGALRERGECACGGAVGAVASSLPLRPLPPISSDQPHPGQAPAAYKELKA
jgi:hypothetical protein